jgi:hypothetical protein
LLAIGGDVLWGKHELLRMIQRVLGPFVVIAHEACEQHITEMVGWDSLAVLIDPPYGASDVQKRTYVRRPTWVSEAAWARRYDGMRFCTDQTANVLGLGNSPNFLELALVGRPNERCGDTTEDCQNRRPLLVRRMADQFGRLREVILPAWQQLLAVQEGETQLMRTIATLLAGAWVLCRDDDPQESDFEALQPELDRLMGVAHEWRTPAWLQVLDYVRGMPVQLPYGNTTLLERIEIAAGARAVGEIPMLGPEERWTEARAIEHAKRDPEARRARQLIGQYGVKILNDLPEVIRTADHPGGYRVVAFAVSAPVRDTYLERMTGWGRLVSQGLGFRTLLQAPRAMEHPSTEHFYELNSRHCILVPLDLVIEGMGGEDPEGTAAAWRRAGDA